MKTIARVSARRVVRRRGAIAILLALLLIPLLGFTAFCVDIGWITVTRSELQNAADSAALAGARQLIDHYAAYSVPLQGSRQGVVRSAVREAKTYAGLYGQYNGAGGVASLAILADDIQVGFTDSAGGFLASYAGYPNTVQVLARRDEAANSPLSLFFAPVLGTRRASLTASAAATVYCGLITSFDPEGGGLNCLLLPMAFDVNHWTMFLATRLSPDGRLHADAGGTPQLCIYPNPKLAPGNSGLLSIGPQANSTPDFRDWIRDGPSDADLRYLLGSGALPVSRQAPRPWRASPGLRSTLRNEFAQVIGQPRLLPLFQPASVAPYQGASGGGSNATYNVVGFAGVIVSEVTGAGENLSISVQPADVVDPTAVFDPSTLYPVGAEPTTQLQTFTYTAPKLTR